MSFRFVNLRSSFGLACFLAALFGYPWVMLAFAVALCVRWRAWEVVAFAVFFDLLWLPNGISPENPPLATIVSVVLVVVLEAFRRQLLPRS